jgi:ABC-type uncharacterized transport system involved in gliding motility auxiliary subunit
MEKRQKAATESFVLVVIVAGIFIALNALSALGGYKRIDFTANKRYSLSAGSGNLLRSMKQEMKVDFYVTTGLPKLDTFVRDFRDLLMEYKAASGGKFDFTIIEPKTEDEKKAARELKLQEQPFGEANDTEAKASVAKGFMGLIIKYGGETDNIPYLPPDRTDGLEFWLSNKIRGLKDKGDNVTHKVGVLTGHDEIKLSEANLVAARQGKYNMQEIITQNFPFYKFEDVDLKAGDAEISDALDGLIITQPGKELTEKELRRIDQFVMKGKSLAVFASAVNVKASDPTMEATLNLWGLDKLMGGYGLEVQKDVVLDFGLPLRPMIPTAQGMVPLPIRFPQVPTLIDLPGVSEDSKYLDTSFPTFFRSTQSAFPFASSINIKKEKQPDAKEFRMLARSSPRSLRETTDKVDLKPARRWAPKGQAQQYGLAATVEGTLTSAFAAGDKMGVERPDKAIKSSRVLLVASSQFFANPFARSGNGPDLGPQMAQFGGAGGDEDLLTIASGYQANLQNAIIALKSTLDWISGDTDLLASSAKILNESNLVYDTTAQANFADESEEQTTKRDEEMRKSRKTRQRYVEGGLILALPVLFAIFGLIRWRLRMNARENLSLA